jgi:hypothetical protein
MKAVIEHKPGNHYIINMHALHHTCLVRAILSRHLTAPIPLFEDREKKHHKLAAELRVTKDGKWKAAQEKRDVNKVAQEAEAGVAGGSGSGTNAKKRKTAPSS